jgi:hypothetical protein
MTKVNLPRDRNKNNNSSKFFGQDTHFGELKPKKKEEESKYLVNKALGKICFAFNTETFSQRGHSRENPNSIVYKRSADY